MKKLFLTVFLLSCLTAVFAAPENGPIRIPLRGWTAWGHNTPVRISVKDSEIIFQRKNGKYGWNTPIYTFPKDRPRPIVTPFTFLKFEYRVPASRRIDVFFNGGTDAMETS